jgi:hypothetical protein
VAEVILAVSARGTQINFFVIHLCNLPFVQMSVPQSIGQRFMQLIQHLGMSKNAFAQSLDKTATVIQHLVEERNKPGYDLLCKVFEVYPNVSKDWLMEGTGPMMKMDKPVAEPTPLVATVPASPVAAAEVATATPLFNANEPAPTVASPAPPAASSAPAPITTPPQPVPTSTMPVAPAFEAAAAPGPAPAPAAPSAPDPAYFAVALQTQYLQHQLALAEQRNQHLLEQQALMQQLVAVLQRSSV